MNPTAPISDSPPEAELAFASSVLPAAPATIKFPPSQGFQRAIKDRVEAYFRETGKKKRDTPQLYIKSVIIMIWLAVNYAALVVVPALLGVQMSWWVVLLLGAGFGLACAAVGFNIQHDGGHQAASEKRWINRVMAFSLDILGGSSYLWNVKHNHLHHTFVNITGHDDDIDIGVVGRLAPQHPHYWFHRFQHIYLWFLYGFIVVRWQLVLDFTRVVTGAINGHKFPRPKGLDLFLFIAGKSIFITLFFVIPMILYPVHIVIAVYFFIAWVQGLTLSVVFQLAHCVEEAEFPQPEPDSDRMEHEFFVHQIETTVDFARSSKLINWYVGGLNFQIEHHLFPRISHVHYPAISRIVEDTCREFGVRYNAHETLRSSIASHYRWIHRMGRGEMAGT